MLYCLCVQAFFCRHRLTVLLLQSLVKSTLPTIGYTSDIERDVLEVPSAHEQEFCDLLTFPIIISIANYFILAFLSIAVNALLPLFFQMPVSMGGLDLDPAAIGYLMGMYGAGTGFFQLLFFARIVRRYGTRRVFIISLSMFIPLFALFPATSIVAKAFGVDCWAVWVLVGSMLSLLILVETAYGVFHLTPMRTLIDNNFHIIIFFQDVYSCT
jgi:hypothetical protein